jgi:hypothetical protein
MYVHTLILNLYKENTHESPIPSSNICDCLSQLKKLVIWSSGVGFACVTPPNIFGDKIGEKMTILTLF